MRSHIVLNTLSYIYENSINVSYNINRASLVAQW